MIQTSHFEILPFIWKRTISLLSFKLMIGKKKYEQSVWNLKLKKLYFNYSSFSCFVLLNACRVWFYTLVRGILGKMLKLSDYEMPGLQLSRYNLTFLYTKFCLYWKTNCSLVNNNNQRLNNELNLVSCCVSRI